MSRGRFNAAFWAWLAFVLVACTANPTTDVQLVQELSATPVPTFTEALVTCADVDANWGKDWSAVLIALEQLIATNHTCGDEPLSSKKYAAHFNYAITLEGNGQFEAAIQQYQDAFLIDPHRSEALDALVRLDALPEPTPPTCFSTSAPRPDPAPAETPSSSSFITVVEDQLMLNGDVFKIRGVNYYPRPTPWHRFLEESDPAEMAVELDLVKQAGFNTLRVFLWYDPLFTCQPEDAIPDEETFARVDALLQLAREQDFKLIITLNDLPDLTFRPLYTDWDRYDAQTVYIVRRYRNEPSILAWDLRNEGDLDYGARPGDQARFSQAEVVDWLSHISQVVRENDPYHLLTAGWWGDPTVTGSYVDFLSFHHWSDAQQLQSRVEGYRSRSDQPLLLQEVGYHSCAAALYDQSAESTQAQALGSVVSVAEGQDISGWLVWTAFDFVPHAGQPANCEHFFGLWRSDLTPKPALEVLSLQ